MSTQYEGTLREWLAMRLGEDVPDTLWELLEEEHAVSDAENYPKKGRHDLLKLARRYLRFHREMPGPGFHAGSLEYGPTARPRSAELPDSLVAKRAEALLLLWGKLVAADRGVKRFRNEVLEGDMLSAATARDLIRSPAAETLPALLFKKRGIPIIGHTAEVLENEQGAHGMRVKLKLTWPGGERTLEYARGRTTTPEPRLFWDGEEELYLNPWRFSVLRRLHEEAAKIALRYPWEPDEAAWLILTGSPPWHSPLTAHVSGPNSENHGLITIEAAHWVPKEAVSKFYAEMKASTAPTSTPSAKRLAVFRFVVERSSAIGANPGEDRYPGELALPNWPALTAAWNQDHPPGNSWHYRSYRNFRRDFVETKKALYEQD